MRVIWSFHNDLIVIILIDDKLRCLAAIRWRWMQCSNHFSGFSFINNMGSLLTSSLILIIFFLSHFLFSHPTLQIFKFNNLININIIYKSDWRVQYKCQHIGFGYSIQATRKKEFEDLTIAFKMAFESSWHPSIPIWPMWLADFRFCVNNLFFFFSFLLNFWV
jgi:hypothetical protein